MLTYIPKNKSIWVLWEFSDILDHMTGERIHHAMITDRFSFDKCPLDSGLLHLLHLNNPSFHHTPFPVARIFAHMYIRLRHRNWA